MAGKKKDRNIFAISVPARGNLVGFHVACVKHRDCTSARGFAGYSKVIFHGNQDDSSSECLGILPNHQNSDVIKKIYFVARHVRRHKSVDLCGQKATRRIVKTNGPIGLHAWPVDLIPTIRISVRFWVLFGRAAFRVGGIGGCAFSGERIIS